MATILFKKEGDKVIQGRFDALEVGSAIAVGWSVSDKLDEPKIPDDKDALEEIARGYGVELDKRKSLANLQKQVQELIDGEQGRPD